MLDSEEDKSNIDSPRGENLDEQKLDDSECQGKDDNYYGENFVSKYEEKKNYATSNINEDSNKESFIIEKNAAQGTSPDKEKIEPQEKLQINFSYFGPQYDSQTIYSQMRKSKEDETFEIEENTQREEDPQIKEREEKADEFKSYQEEEQSHKAVEASEKSPIEIEDHQDSQEQRESKDINKEASMEYQIENRDLQEEENEKNEAHQEEEEEEQNQSIQENEGNKQNEEKEEEKIDNFEKEKVSKPLNITEEKANVEEVQKNVINTKKVKRKKKPSFLDDFVVLGFDNDRTILKAKKRVHRKKTIDNTTNKYGDCQEKVSVTMPNNLEGEEESEEEEDEEEIDRMVIQRPMLNDSVYFALPEKGRFELIPHINQKSVTRLEFSSHIDYDINLITSDKLVCTKCKRRYNEFDTFYNKLTSKYPYLFIPQLPSKNITNKIISDQLFLSTRKKELTQLLNYIYSEEKLYKLPECYVFITSPEFDSKYFLNQKDNFCYEIERHQNKFKNLASSVSKYFKKEEKTMTEEEERLRIKFAFYTKLLADFKGMKREVIAYNESQTKLNENFLELEKNLLYLKDVKGLMNFHTMQYTSGFVAKNTQKNDELLDKMSWFTLILKGVVDLLNRYFKFLEKYKLTDTQYRAQMKDSNYSDYTLEFIASQAKEKKKDFERILEEELNSFSEKYTGEVQKLLNEFVNVIKENVNDDIKSNKFK